MTENVTPTGPHGGLAAAPASPSSAPAVAPAPDLTGLEGLSGRDLRVQLERRAATAAPETQSPPEARRLALTKELTAANSKLTDEERAAKTRALRELVASQATDEEKAAIAGATLEEHRRVYDLKAPNLPAPWLESYIETTRATRNHSWPRSETADSKRQPYVIYGTPASTWPSPPTVSQ